MVLVCGDSHTATHGALGALAIGIGASQVAHVLATQAVWLARPRLMRITIDGSASFGVTAKDIALSVIARIGAGGGIGYAIEYAGQAVRDLSIEGRLTLCNLSVEAGARAGLIAPDEKTFAFLAGRPFAPAGGMWGRAVGHWRTLPSDPGATFDAEIAIPAAEIAPMVTWGTSPEQAVPVTGRIPDPAAAENPAARAAMEAALAYMDLVPGQAIAEIPVDRVFVGSCTNARIEDLRAVAEVARGRRAVVPTMIVPGSTLVKAEAEREGLDRIFQAAGFEWRESGCSMCVGINGDTAEAGERTASTTNRNFVGRQGDRVKTHLVSPAMAAAAAVTGRLADVRSLASADEG
jgi:3-isopropylmalate/(R)-2-methylmalate dehydratase large subunit